MNSLSFSCNENDSNISIDHLMFLQWILNFTFATLSNWRKQLRTHIELPETIENIPPSSIYRYRHVFLKLSLLLMHILVPSFPDIRIDKHKQNTLSYINDDGKKNKSTDPKWKELNECRKKNFKREYNLTCSHSETERDREEDTKKKSTTLIHSNKKEIIMRIAHMREHIMLWMWL